MIIQSKYPSLAKAQKATKKLRKLGVSNIKILKGKFGEYLIQTRIPNRR